MERLDLTRIMDRRARDLVALLVVALLSGGCFEAPVQERLEISFDEGQTTVVRAEILFAEGQGHGAVRERLTTLRREYLDLRDPWTARFDRLAAKHESYQWERSQGELVRVARSARIDADRLSDLFYDTAIRVSYTERDGMAELAMYAGASQRATREQHDEYRDVLDQFSQDVRVYFRAMDAVYEYLEVRPERAVPIFAALVGEGENREPTTADEEALLDVVSEASDRVTGILATGATRAYSFEEISSLVNDPFPAEVVILTAGEVVELEGFERDEATGGLRVPRVSLWAAFESLRGHWLSPDPLVIAVAAALDESSEPIAPETLAAEPRISRPPADWRVVRDELSSRLTTPDTYRARWIITSRPR